MWAERRGASVKLEFGKELVFESLGDFRKAKIRKGIPTSQGNGTKKSIEERMYITYV